MALGLRILGNQPRRHRPLSLHLCTPGRPSSSKSRSDVDVLRRLPSRAVNPLHHGLELLHGPTLLGSPRSHFLLRVPLRGVGLVYKGTLNQ